MQLKVLILDDHKIFSESLRMVLESQNFLVKNFTDAELAIKFLKAEGYDIVITDIRMPNISGIEFLKQIKELEGHFKKKPKYVVLTSSTEVNIFKQLYTIGIDAFLSKNVSQIELITALKKVLNNEKYYEKSVYDLYLKTNGNQTNEIEFTSRELDVLKLIIEEKTTSEIAEKLEISPYTVEGHRKNLLQKTNSKNVVGLIKYSLLNNLF